MQHGASRIMNHIPAVESKFLQHATIANIDRAVTRRPPSGSPSSLIWKQSPGQARES